MLPDLRCVFILLLSALAMLFSGCVPTMVTKHAKFPLMYEEKPKSIVILPPINNSTAAEAKEYYSTTIQEPLSLTGFYTFPYEITSDLFKMEGIYDAELLQNMPVIKFRDYLGADAVLFTTIDRWDLTYMVIASNLTVGITCELKSTHSEQTLWKYSGVVVVDLSGGNTGGGLAGLVAKAIITAVNSAVVDYVPYAKRANIMSLGAIPVGPYHNLHTKDKDVQIVDQAPTRSTQ